VFDGVGAMGQVVTGSRSWLRWRRKPDGASRSTPKATGPPPEPARCATHVLHLDPQVDPPTRASCSATRSSLSRRWAPGATCWKSHPPHRPRAGMGADRVHPVGRRLQDLDGIGTEERRGLRGHRARTRSPGRLCRTKTTRPSGPRATHPRRRRWRPPRARRGRPHGGGSHARFLARWRPTPPTAAIRSGAGPPPRRSGRAAGPAHRAIRSGGRLRRYGEGRPAARASGDPREGRVDIFERSTRHGPCAA